MRLSAAVAVALIAAAGQEAPWTPSEPDEWNARLVPDGRTPTLQNVEGNDCLRCHAAIGEEWRQSAHATAWQDEHYQEALTKVRREQSCWGCHVPEQLATGGEGRPAPREERRHLGIDCVACHLAADGETAQ